MSAATMDSRHAGRDLLTGTVCYLLACVAWGLNIPLTVILFRTFDPFFLTPVRVAVATLVLAAIVVTLHGAKALRLGTTPARFAGISLTMALFFVFYNLGLKFTDPITAAAIMAGAPVYAAMTLRFVAHAPLGKGFASGATLTLIGAGIAVASRASAGTQGLQLRGGELLIILSFVCWTLYSVLAQRWFDPSVPQLRRTYVSTMGTLPWLIACWAAVRALGLVGEPNLHPGPEAVLWLLVTAVLATALGGFAWNIGVHRMGVAAGSLWQNTVPVFGVLTSMLFGLFPSAGQVLGGAIVLGGVLLMQWRRARG